MQQPVEKDIDEAAKHVPQDMAHPPHLVPTEEETLCVSVSRDDDHIVVGAACKKRPRPSSIRLKPRAYVEGALGPREPEVLPTSSLWPPSPQTYDRSKSGVEAALDFQLSEDVVQLPHVKASEEDKAVTMWVRPPTRRS